MTIHHQEKNNINVCVFLSQRIQTKLTYYLSVVSELVIWCSTPWLTPRSSHAEMSLSEIEMLLMAQQALHTSCHTTMSIWFYMLLLLTVQ